AAAGGRLALHAGDGGGAGDQRALRAHRVVDGAPHGRPRRGVPGDAGRPMGHAVGHVHGPLRRPHRPAPARTRPGPAARPRLVTDPVRASFDRIAEQYAADFADELTRKPYDTALLRDVARRCRGGPVLDVGCGPAAHVGRFVAELGPRVIGVDLAPRSLTVARRLNDPTLALVAVD